MIVPQGTGAVKRKLSELQIDVDKDWSNKNITNFGTSGVNLHSIVTSHASRHASGGADAILSPLSWSAVNSPREATIVVAASNSRDTTRADYVCDGTDDQVEINAAINQVGWAKGSVVLLEGDYYVTDSINLVSFVSIRGQGQRSTRIHVPSNFNSDINVFYCGSFALDTPSVSNLTVDGNKANQSSGTMRGFYIREPNDVTIQGLKIDRCYIHGFRNEGVYVNHGDKFYFSMNYIENGIYATDLTNSLFIGNEITNTSGGSAIYLTSSSNSNTLLSNYIHDADQYGIFLYASKGNIISYNIIKNNSRSSDNMYDGIFLSSDSDENIYTIIAGNIISSPSDPPRHRYNIYFGEYTYIVLFDGNIAVPAGASGSVYYDPLSYVRVTYNFESE